MSCGGAGSPFIQHTLYDAFLRCSRNKVSMATYCGLALIALAFGWVSRMCGGGPPKLPWVTDQLIYALPYAFIASPAGPWAVLAYAGAVLGKLTGHGRGISLGEPMKEGSKPERLEYLILWLQPYLPVYWYKVLILSVTGLAVTALPSVVLLPLDPRASVLILLSGLLKAPAYMLGWKIGKKPTEIGEFLTGFFCVSALLIISQN